MNPGVSCSKCNCLFHLTCIADGRILRKDAFVCDACAGASTNKTSAENATGTGVDGGTFVFSHPAGNSTMLPPATGDEKDARINELEAMLKAYKEKEIAARNEFCLSRTEGAPYTGLTGVASSVTSGKNDQVLSGTSAPSTTGMIVNANPPTIMSTGMPPSSLTVTTDRHASALYNLGAQQQSFVYNRSSHSNGTNSSFDRSMWRSRLPQSILDRTANPIPLTKEQIARRKSMNTVLPKFNGNPLQWLSFVTSFLETAGPVCGFTAREDMDRVRAALQTPALNLVSAQMDNGGENLDVVMGTLQLSYGDPGLILATMTEQVNRMSPLKDDLSNVADFAGQVDSLRSITNMMDGQPNNLEIMRKLERKLPLRYGEEWLVFRASRMGVQPAAMYTSMVALPVEGDINQLADFLLYLHERAISLGRYLPTPSGGDNKKRVLLVHDPRTDVQASLGCDPEVPVDVPSTGTTNSPPRNDTRRSAAAAGGEMCRLHCGHPTHRWTVCPSFQQLVVGRRWHFVKRFKKCFLCLDDHRRDQCTATAVCNVDNCGRRHHPLLHPVGAAIEEVVQFNHEDHKTTIFRILPVVIRSNNSQKKVVALMDPASSVTLMHPTLAKELGLSGPKKMMALSGYDGEARQELWTEAVTFELENVVSGEVFTAHAKTDATVKLPMQSVTKEFLRSEGLENLNISSFKKERPLLLIGLDNAPLLRVLKSWVGLSGNVLASQTPLGCVLDGEVTGNGDMICLVTNSSTDKRMEAMLTNYLEEERFGLQPDGVVVAESDENRRARAMMEENTKQRADGRYETGLLWRNEREVLPNNRDLAVRRHVSFERKLARDKVLRDKIME